MLMALMIVPFASQAQLNAMYQFSTGVDATKWYTLTTDSVMLLDAASFTTSETATTGDSKKTEVTNIGFTFSFAGVDYTQFSVNSDGTVRLGSTQVGTGAYSNPFSASNANTNAPKICGLGCDGCMVFGDYIAYEVFGTAPERVCVIEVSTGTYNSTTRSNHYKFQVQLAEEDNSVTLIYSPVAPAAGPNTTYQLGASASASDIVLFNVADNTMTTLTAGTTTNNASGTWPAAGRYYTIAPDADACLPVTNLTVSNITSSSATLTWHGEGVSYTLYEYGNPDSAAYIFADTVANLVTLEPNTEYTFGVTATCANDNESNMTTVTFRTACTAIATLPYTMGFEESEIAGTASADAFPFCWTRINTLASGTYTYYPYSSSSNSYAGSRKLYFYASSYGTYADTTGFVMPELDVVTYPMNTTRVTFWAKVTSTTPYTVLVGTMTDPTDRSTFSLVESVTVSGTDYTKYAVSMATASATAPYVAFLVPKVNATMYIDDVTLEEMPACLEVSGVANPDNTSATYSVYNMADTSLVMDDITTTSYTVTGLNAGTQYTFAVQANCPAGDAAMMSVTGYTACGPVALPFSEDFSATLSSHPCWRGATGTTADEVLAGTALTLTANSQWIYSSSESNGIAAGHYRVNIYGTSCKKWMITPEIDLSTASNAQLSFDAVFTAYSGTGAATGFESNTSQKFMVLVSTNNGATWATAADISLANIAGTAYSTQVVNMTPYVGDTVRIAFYAQSTTSGGDNNLHIDNILVQETAGETCYPVSAVTVSNVTESGVTLSWTGDADSYTIVDMADPSVALFTVTETTVAPAALAPMTQYTYGIIANCGTNHSDTVTVTFATACSSITLPFTETFEATSATTGCWTTDGPGNWTIATGDYSSTTGAFEGSLNAKITHGTTGDATKLISPVLDLGTADGLQLVFAHIQRSWAGDIDELRVYTRASATAAWDTVAEYTDAVATWTVETLNLTGTIYQVAFEMTDSYGYGVGIDSVVFNLPPACMPVTNLTVDSATSTSVFLSWDGTATAYNIYTSTGDVVATGVTTTEYEVTGLTALTAYTFGVVAVCGTTTSDVTLVNAVTACGGATCNISIVGTDSYGDGWNGNAINVMQAGVVIGTFTLTSGSSATETFTVCSSAPVSFTWVSGNYADETSFEIKDGGDMVVYSVADGSTLTNGQVIYTLTDACPSCIPAAITVDTVTTTSVTISWTGTAASYDVYNGETFVANVTTNTYTFTGLNPASTYTFGVQAICSATDTANLATVAVMTACADITTLPYMEGFENGLGCWSTVNGSADGYPWFTASSTSGVTSHSGNNMAISVSYYSGAVHANAWLISPKFILPTIGTGDTLNLSWWHAVSSAYPTELYDVMLSTTTDDTAAFTTTLLAVNPDSSLIFSIINMNVWFIMLTNISKQHINYYSAKSA